MIKKRLWKPIAASLLSFSLLAGSFSTAATNEQSQVKAASLPKNAVQVTVKDVIDGDTIKVVYKGKEETVRMILIDTPETVAPNKCIQLYGPEATAYAKKYLLDKKKTVSIELGTQTRDTYGRILAYVYVNETMFNRLQLQNGYARIAIYPPNTQYLEELQADEAKAKNAKIGIWSDQNAINGGCAPVQKPAPVTKPKPAPTPPKKESFKNCTELRKKYPDGVKKGHPAYDEKHDRDKDGWACER